jgi:hypothetical protein
VIDADFVKNLEHSLPQLDKKEEVMSRQLAIISAVHVIKLTDNDIFISV